MQTEGSHRSARLFAAMIVSLPTASLLHVASRCEGATELGRTPNVILVITDDQGYGDLGCHGNTMIRTPHLDRLYKQSVRLTDFHVSPCCTPTRAALMTGRHCIRTGAWGTTWGRSLPRGDEVMMARAFADAGYRTGAFGKWHLGDNYPFRPQDRGFQEVLIHGGGGVGQTPDYWGNDYFDDTYFHNGQPQEFTGYCTDVWFDGALEFIQANKARPFFVYLTTNAPHGPLNVDPKYSRPYEQKGVPADMAKFYGMIENIDENMGRLLGSLDSWNVSDNTILIFMTDNGTANGVVPARAKTASGDRAESGPWTGFNAGMRGKKGSLYDGGHRVPCFIRWPVGGLAGDRDIDRLTDHTDLFPTLIDLCGLAEVLNVPFDGRSLVPLLTVEDPKWPDRKLFVQYRQSSDPPRKSNAAVMSERWRFVNGKELYDIDADPAQRRDLAGQHPDVVREFSAAYEMWWSDVSRRFDEYNEIVLGGEAENPARLTAFDWHTVTPWNQNHIRNGVRSNGLWAVEIARPGNYRISLRRWPPEVDQPITAAVPGGKSIRATEARLAIGPLDRTQPIPDGATCVTFDVPLERGKTTLQTWLSDKSSGESRGAYFVSVERVSD